MNHAYTKPAHVIYSYYSFHILIIATPVSLDRKIFGQWTVTIF
jgi:hypothetical protein